MPPPGKNVWKYLIELDRRRTSYKTRGKTFVFESPRKIEERVEGEPLAKGYACSSDSEDSINTQEDCTYEKARLVPKLELASLQAIRDKIGYTPVTDENDQDVSKLKSIDRQAMAHFVERSFVEWGWSDNETHLAEIAQFSETYDAIEDPGRKKLYLSLIQAMRRERTKFRQQFEKEFMFTRKGYVKGIKFIPATQEFHARMEYPVMDHQAQQMVKKVTVIQVSERWMRSEFPPEVVKHVVDMAMEEDGFKTVPEGVSMQLLDKKIVRVRYQPSQRRLILDAEKIRKIGEEALQLQRAKIKEKKDKQLKQGLRSSSRKKDDKEQEEDLDLPKKEVVTQPRWVVKFDDNTTMVVGEELVREHFGDAFVNELLSLRRGYVDIPVGDNKPSRLHLHPDLLIPHAPPVIYTQATGRDLCVPKALASVLYQLGFKNEASRVDLYGEQHLNGGTVDALRKVFVFATKVLPSFVQGTNLPCDYDWRRLVKEDLTSIVLGVISASDGSNSHAIAIHGGYVYDANETIAIPLSQKALDYCASTDTVESKFVKFRKGYMFAYAGQKPSKIARMTLQLSH